MPRKRPPPTIEIGSPGLRQWGGRVDEEQHLRLRGAKAAKIYEEMRLNDATIGAAFYTIESYLRRVPWRAVGPDKAEQEFLQSVMDDMDQTWDETVSDILSMLVYGHALHEVVYKVRIGPDEENPRYRSASDDHRFGWRQIALRAQTTIDRWDIDPEYGTINGCWQQPPAMGGSFGERYLPMSRCLLFRTSTLKNNPEGRSILRTAYRSWFFKKRLEESEAAGIHRDATGIPVVNMPVNAMARNASAELKAMRHSMETLVSQIDNNERKGIVFPAETNADGKPTGYKLSLLTSNGTKQILVDPVIRRHDSRIAMSMAAEFLMLGTEKQGSFALGSEKSANFIRSLGWYVDVIQETLQKAVTRLYAANGVPVEKRARIEAGEIDGPSLQEFGLFLQQAAAAGFLHPRPEDEKRLRELAHLPEIDLEELQAAFEEEKALEEEARQMEAESMKVQNEATMAAAKAPPATASAAAAGATSTSKSPTKAKAKK